MSTDAQTFLIFLGCLTAAFLLLPLTYRERR